jgi:hypothetical protein
MFPFSVYLGWVTIATIANIAVMLVSIGWDGFGISLQTWAILVLAVAVLIDLIVIATRKDIAYSLVFIWALAGIAVNQLPNPTIVLTVEVAIVIIAVALAITAVFFATTQKKLANNYPLFLGIILNIGVDKPDWIVCFNVFFYGFGQEKRLFSA